MQFFDTEELLKYGNEALQIISEKYKDLENQRVIPDVQPGFLRNQLPEEMPEKGESFETLFQDTKDIIMPGITKWQSPNFFAYFPSNLSSATIIGDMLGLAMNSPGFTWIASPAATELENIVVDWIAKLFDLPEKFLIKNSGGGAIMTAIGTSIFMTVHHAKFLKIQELSIDLKDEKILKFVGYYTAITHSENSKALLLKDIPYQRCIPVYWNEEINSYRIKIPELIKIIEKDLEDGLIPFWLAATIGSTSIGACDPISELGKICQKYKIYFSVDAAWAGACFSVPELRKEYGDGLEYADALHINFGKWMMAGNGSAVMYIADKKTYTESLGGKNNPEYLKNKFTDNHDIIDYKDWQVGLGRRFNSMRIWFILRKYGVQGHQANILNSIELAKKFEKLLVNNPRFSLFCKRELTLICFRLIKDKDGKDISEDELNLTNKKLIEKINEDGKYYLVGSEVQGNYIIRWVNGNPNVDENHVEDCWKHIEKCSLEF